MSYDEELNAPAAHFSLLDTLDVTTSHQDLPPKAIPSNSVPAVRHLRICDFVVKAENIPAHNLISLTIEVTYSYDVAIEAEDLLQLLSRTKRLQRFFFINAINSHSVSREAYFSAFPINGIRLDHLTEAYIDETAWSCAFLLDHVRLSPDAHVELHAHDHLNRTPMPTADMLSLSDALFSHLSKNGTDIVKGRWIACEPGSFVLQAWRDELEVSKSLIHFILPFKVEDSLLEECSMSVHSHCELGDIDKQDRDHFPRCCSSPSYASHLRSLVWSDKCVNMEV